MKYERYQVTRTLSEPPLSDFIGSAVIVAGICAAICGFLAVAFFVDERGASGSLKLGCVVGGALGIPLAWLMHTESCRSRRRYVEQSLDEILSRVEAASDSVNRLHRAIADLAGTTRVQYTERRYRQFWRTIDSAAQNVDSLLTILRTYERDASEYTALLSGTEHSYPPVHALAAGFPPLATLSAALRTLISTTDAAERDHEFASLQPGRRSIETL